MASASDFSKKPHSLVQEPTSTIPQIPSQSHSNTLCKSFIIVLVLAAIPLFPSQAPEFISKSIFSEVWEIIHLLFIGIALSYGLFCKKSTQLETECVYSRNDGFNSYLTGFMNVPSVFEDGFENLCGSDEKIMTRSIKNRSFVVSENGVENIHQGSGKRASQTEIYRYPEGESTVVVEDGKYFLDESIEYKPLNLPIRSLRSRIVDSDKPELVDRSKSTPSSEGKNTDKVKLQKIRGVVPQNLEKKFAEAGEQPPPIPWRSRTEMSNRDEPVTRSRPLSVDESEFEHIEFDSFEDSTLCSSPEVPRPYVENVEMKKKKGLKLSSVPGSRSRVAPENAEGSGTGSKTRPFSIGSSSEINMLRNYDKISMDCEEEEEEEEEEEGTLRKGKENNDSLVSDVKLSKVPPRAKSVRTIRNSGYFVDELRREKPSSPIDDKFEIMHYKFEPDSLVKRGSEIEELEDPPNSLHHYSGSSPAIFSEFQTQQRDINTRVSPKYQKELEDPPNLSHHYSNSSPAICSEFQTQRRDINTRVSPKYQKELEDPPNSAHHYSSSSPAICSEFQTQRRDIKRRVSPKYQKELEDPPNSSHHYSNSSPATYSEFQTQRRDINTRVSPKYQKEGIRENDDPNEVEWVAPKYQKEGKQDFDEPNEIESEEDPGNEFDTSSGSEDAATFLDDNSELEGSEVDRKADEFIAKFREQIRLQKIASAKGNSVC